MPRAATYDEIIDSNPDVWLPSIMGRVKKIFPRKEGDNDYGHWTIQGMMVDMGGRSIKCSVYDSDVIDHLSGKVITVTAGEKGMGIKTIDNNYEGKVTRQLKITPSATIEVAEDQSAPAATQTSKPAQGTSKPANAQPASDVHPFIQASKRVTQLANLYIVCCRSAIKAHGTIGEDHDTVLTEGFLQSIAQTIFIASEKRQLDELMPSAKIIDSEIAATAKAEKAKEAKAAAKPAEPPPARKPIDPDAPLPAGGDDEDDDVPY